MLVLANRCIRITRKYALSSNGVQEITWAAQPLGIVTFQCRNWCSQGRLAGKPLSISSAEMKLTVVAENSDVLPSARAFVSSEGKRFEWRRNRDDPTSYDLYASHNTRIAVFRRYRQATAIGPSHAVLQYSFTQDSLLTEALVALCVTRWVDIHGL
ncbi:hypothetical protein CVT25_015765 [Psilocybe cyanescens]|uniref:Uncharacterized protein n=1 Tax=Psilocybe cyanescens TaxID=93625 RepID=A0A409WRY1_PSICY|nr:hypothetical protein CVT25_015765 [Psilocybe cyanescens]